MGERTAGGRDSDLVRQTAELFCEAGPLSDIFERFCVLLARYVDASVVFIALESRDGTYIEFAYDHGVTIRDAHVRIREESQSFRVMHSGESLLMRGPDDLPAELVPLQIPGASKEDSASAIFVSLRFGLRPIGVFSVQSDKPDAYDQHDVQLLETCALYVAAGLQPAGETASRRVFEERLRTQWNRARREDIAMSVILMDLDFFKSFNQTYGPLAGDSCLAQVAQAARVCVDHDAGVFARYGGEQFGAILLGATPDDALRAAESMREAVCESAYTARAKPRTRRDGELRRCVRLTVRTPTPRAGSRRRARTIRGENVGTQPRCLPKHSYRRRSSRAGWKSTAPDDADGRAIARTRCACP